MVEVLDFLMGYESYLRQVGARNRPEKIVIRYVCFVSLSFICMHFNLKVVFIYRFFTPPSRRYFQGHSPWENPTSHLLDKKYQLFLVINYLLLRLIQPVFFPNKLTKIASWCYRGVRSLCLDLLALYSRY
jgi:hypothetical protein